MSSHVGLRSYAELHALSNFSFLRGASHPAELITQAHHLGYRALALTDECSLAGVVRAHDAVRALEAPDFKLIIGAEFRTSCGLKLVLLAPSQHAYGQLCQLITLGRRRSKKGEYRLAREDFESGLQDCLALWAADPESRASQARWLRDFFPGRSWLAIELHRTADQASRLQAALALAQDSGLPAVASGDVHMHVRERRPLQDVMTAIRHGCTIDTAGWRLFPNAERHLRSLQDLRSLYPPELLTETLAIAERCTFSLSQLRYEYPPELVPAGLSATEHLAALTRRGLQRRWPQGAPAGVMRTIEQELALIAELRYEHFFLTVHDLVEYARRKNILCQGRGSAANSAVCFALGITEIDPARMQLLFERFISRERNEPPDIDVDFEHERREEVVQYIYDKYGRERAALAATVICYRTKSAVRDVARALGVDDAAINRLTRMHVWWDPPGEIQRRFADDGAAIGERLELMQPLVRELIGFPRHLSQHVGGFVISGEPLSALVPIENASMPDRTVIQWDKDDLETLGLLKVDVLALGMLTALHRCFDLVEAYSGRQLSIAGIPHNDAGTYDMICRAETIGVFQIESRAQMSMLPRLQPRNFYDLVIEVAIVRPGPIQGDMVHPYLQRREDRNSVTYPSPQLKIVLERTLGVPIFQEQVMQIAVVAADFTPGEADGLRRAMAAWKRKGGMQPYRDRLMTGMAKNGYSPEFADQIYKQIAGFGEYGFPESHAASFALLTYVSSWLKCHEPAAFAAALINSQPMGFYAPAQITQEVRRQQVTVLAADVGCSEWDCTLEFTDATAPYLRRPDLRLGLRLVRGLARAEADHIIEQRLIRPFTSIDDLAARAGLPQRAVQALAAAGALSTLSTHRHEANWKALGVERLPALVAGLSAAESPAILPRPSEEQDILADYRHLGLTTGRHPLALLRPSLMRRGFSSSRDLQELADGRRVRVGGLVTHMQQPATASGVVFASLEDETGIVNIILWPKVFQAQRRSALESSVLVVDGVLQRRNRVAHVVAHRLRDASAWLGLTRASRDFH
ncbi:MAG TPA: error-prone DNA polymerase [Steroidobacteraceae bacterium]|jgi:error-prone DNA polymerase|nr:error-prone DNA polymerase [Steroidobacteraceae bacterium]